jgi:gamma-glutamyltranspeptidase/glutathione hydrolase
VVYLEGRIPPETVAELRRRGHIVKVQPDWSGQNVLAAMFDARTGVLSAAASPRRDTPYAMGW